MIEISDLTRNWDDLKLRIKKIQEHTFITGISLIKDLEDESETITLHGFRFNYSAWFIDEEVGFMRQTIATHNLKPINEKTAYYKFLKQIKMIEAINK